MVDVYVIGVDGAGNFDFCTVMVNVQTGIDPNPCFEEPDTNGRVAVAGLISTPEGIAVEGVEVSLSGQLSNVFMTGDAGDYTFSDLQIGYDYTITPSLEENVVNGVSTFDLVIITKHILGVEKLDSPYKLLAADVNNSQSITTTDLIQIRKLILNTEENFSKSSSWIFFPKDHTFTNPTDPWSDDMTQAINLNNLAEDMLTGDFMAIKKGDVNGSVLSNSRMARPRNVAGTFQVDALDIPLKAGQEYTIDFTTKELSKIQGYQFTLNFDNSAMELLDIHYGAAKEHNFGLTHVEEGIITTSWTVPGQSQTTQNKSVLFSIQVKAKSDAMLSELLGISSRYTHAEAYSLNNDPLDVKLTFGEGSIMDSKVVLHQNFPNPFTNKTQIGFSLEEASSVMIRIHDLSGRAIKVIRGDFERGENQITVDDLPAGVLFYTFQAGNFIETRKMIHLK
jgi:hypothetical protein